MVGPGLRSLWASRILKDTVIYGLTGAASRLVAVILVPLYTRCLAPSEYGMLDLLTTTSMVLLLLAGLQVESGIGRGFYEAGREGRRGRLVGTGLSLYLLGAVAVTLLGAGVFQAFFAGRAGLPWMRVLPVLAAILPTQFLSLFLLLFRYGKRPWTYSVVAVGDVLVTALLSLAALVWLRAGVAGMLWAMAASKAIWAGIALGLQRPRPRLCWDGPAAREILRYSIPLVPNVVIAWLQNYGNRFVLLGATSLAMVGVYGLAVRVASVVYLIVLAFRFSWNPISMEMIGDPDAREVYARTLDRFLLAVSLVCVVAGALGDTVVRLLAPPAYREAGALVGFVAFGYLWTGSLEIIALGLSVARKTHWGILGYGAGMAVNLLPLSWALRHLGLRGAGLAFLLGSIATALVTLAISQRCYAIPFRRATPLAMLGLSLGMALLSSCWKDLAGARLQGGAGDLLRLGLGLAAWGLAARLGPAGGARAPGSSRLGCLGGRV